MSDWTEIWSVERQGSKVSASVSRDGSEIAIGITNMLSHTGVSNRVSHAQAMDLAHAIIGEIAGSEPTRRRH